MIMALGLSMRFFFSLQRNLSWYLVDFKGFFFLEVSSISLIYVANCLCIILKIVDKLLIFLFYIIREIVTVGSRFVADRSSVGFARKTALTISFVERGFERLGLDQ